MTEDQTDPSLADRENDTPDAPPSRPAPLKNFDRSDKGCMVTLAFILIGVFLFPAFFWLGGAIFIVPCILCFMIALLSPYINPLESRAASAKWWGRVVTFLVLTGAMVTIWAKLFVFKPDAPPPEERQTHGMRAPLGAPAGWS